jgi:hypothetical protein
VEIEIDGKKDEELFAFLLHREKGPTTSFAT